ncbi:MAG: hypothetical protein ACHQ1D_10045 [Nitrososphaerales archaeon]
MRKRKKQPILGNTETRAMLREDFTYKLGRIEYSMTKYQKLIRVLIPFEYEDNKLEYTTVVERCLKK